MLNSAITGPALMVDIGNSNIVCAIFEQDNLKIRYRFETDATYSAEDYFSLFQQKVHHYAIAQFKYVAMCSVVPKVHDIWREMIMQHSEAKIYDINGLSKLGLRYLIKDPAEVGPDLVANAFGAWKKYSGSTLVVDLGTATTIQLIDSEGLYAGVIIAPGVKTAANHLFEKAAMLKNVVLKAPKQLLGNCTTDALLSGIITGHALMLRGFISEIKVNYSQYGPFKVILTGGLASIIAPMCAADYVVDQNLTLEGLYLAMNALIQNES